MNWEVLQQWAQHAQETLVDLLAAPDWFLRYAPARAWLIILALALALAYMLAAGLFRLALLFALLFLLCVAKSSDSQKHEQKKCCVDNSNSFHGRCLCYSLNAGKTNSCIVSNSWEISWAMEFEQPVAC